MNNSIINWLNEHLLTCPSKQFFHFDCPGCGMQRSFLALLHGEIGESLRLYPAMIPLLVLVIFTMLHIKFDFKNGASLIKWGYLSCAIIVFIFYLYKVITHQIF